MYLKSNTDLLKIFKDPKSILEKNHTTLDNLGIYILLIENPNKVEIALKQCAKITLNEIQKTFNKIFAGRKCMLHGFTIYYASNLKLMGMESTN